MGTSKGNIGREMYSTQEYKDAISKAKTLKRIEVEKTCVNCSNPFYVTRTIKQDGTQHISKKEKICCCRECSNTYGNLSRGLNTPNPIRQEKTKQKTKAQFDWFYEFKKQYKCEDCGDTRTHLLTFHHIDKSDKDGEIKSLARLKDKTRFYKEIDKCKCLCHNCHVDLHFREQHPELF